MIDINPELLTILMFSGLIAGLLLGHQLAFVLGGLAVIFGFLAWGPDSFGMFMSRIYSMMDNYVLIAIPLFILMAQLLGQSKVSENLFDSLRYLLGPIRGGVALAVVVVSVLFAACTGIIGASVVTMGVLALPLMIRYQYDKKLSTGVICAGGALGILIPPSIMLIVMGSETGLSVGQLFAGALLPGVILGVLYLAYVFVMCYLHPELGPTLSLEERRSISRREILLKVLKSLVPPMILILGVLGSIFAGIATPTEAAGMGAALALVLIFCYRRFSWAMLFEAVTVTTRATSMVLIVAVGATCFTGVFLGTGGGNVVSEFILSMGMGKWGIFLVMMLINFILGMFIDWLGIVMITFPIFVPIASSLGFDKLWFVVISAVMLQNSFLTPPFGYALIYLRGIAPQEVTTQEIWYGALPFVAIMLFGFIICTFLPEIILWLPALVVK